MITNISKKLAQQIVSTVKEVCGQDINFIDNDGIIFASTNEARIGDFHEIGRKVSQTKNAIEVEIDNSFTGTKKGINLPVFHNGILIAIIGISGEPAKVSKYAHLAERITKLLIREQEINQTNRTNAEKKNYIIDALINGKTFNRDYILTFLSEIKLDSDALMRVLSLRLNSQSHMLSFSVMEQEIYRLFSSAGISLYSYNYPNEYIVILEETNFQSCIPLFDKFAREHHPLLSIGAGSPDTLYHLDHSYHTSQIAQKSAATYHTGLLNYDDLTLEIILESLDDQMRAEYFQKITKNLTKEDFSLLKVYYDEDMSLSQTSRLLYLHKNTLQYKLDRIYKTCGLNPRNFKDGVLFYIALKFCSFT